MRDACKILAQNMRGRILLEAREIHPEFIEDREGIGETNCKTWA
jgi:hypothetical protein